MWISPSFAPNDPEGTARALVARHPLAALIVPDPVRIAHMPLLWRSVVGDAWAGGAPAAEELVGHIPLADPIARGLLSGGEATAVFAGPQSYVSPSWYDGPGLPTYNYAPVHVTGHTRRLSVPELREHLLDLITEHEAAQAAAGCPVWRPDPEAEARMDALLPEIAGFAIAIERLEVKTKLGQNRSDADNRIVRAALAAGTADRPEIAALMHDNRPPGDK